MISATLGRMMGRRVGLGGALAVACAGLLLAGCGSSSSGTTSSAPASTPATTPTSSSSSSSSGAGAAKSAVSLEANKEGELAYNTKSLSAKAGKVSIDFTNMSSLEHNVTIESSSGAILGATPTFQGGSKTLSLNLKPGTYKFFCSVPGHRMAGMEGTLTVQ
ncbi:MAG TPA: plastocyanin/azurin family copper-binding protein [Solirubrobacteraceae bacterium]|nr:plastocyanin/azurin family copper-binding protein [Solirubrobacteraceae bacterium]